MCAQHFLTDQRRWRERRRRRKSGTCQNIHIYYQLCALYVCGSESEQVRYAYSQQVGCHWECICVLPHIQQHMAAVTLTHAQILWLAARHVFVRLPVVVVIFLLATKAVGSCLSRSLRVFCVVLLLLFHFHSRRRMNDNKWSTWGLTRGERERKRASELGNCAW